MKDPITQVIDDMGAAFRQVGALTYKNELLEAEVAMLKGEIALLRFECEGLLYKVES